MGVDAQGMSPVSAEELLAFRDEEYGAANTEKMKRIPVLPGRYAFHSVLGRSPK